MYACGTSYDLHEGYSSSSDTLKNIPHTINDKMMRSKKSLEFLILGMFLVAHL